MFLLIHATLCIACHNKKLSGIYTTIWIVDFRDFLCLTMFESKHGMIKTIVFIALCGTFGICLTDLHRSNRYEACNTKIKQLNYAAKAATVSKKLFN